MPVRGKAGGQKDPKIKVNSRVTWINVLKTVEDMKKNEASDDIYV